MTTETAVQRFWDASQAWKWGKIPGKEKRVSVGDLFEMLNPLECHPISATLRRQAGELSNLIVKGRCRRGKRKGQLIDLRNRIQKSGQDTIAA